MEIYMAAKFCGEDTINLAIGSENLVMLLFAYLMNFFSVLVTYISLLLFSYHKYKIWVIVILIVFANSR